MRYPFSILIFFCCTSIWAQQSDNYLRLNQELESQITKIIACDSLNTYQQIELSEKSPFQLKKRTKGGAILMAILTGPLGGHRLYLGTEPYVPIVYTLTLGGGMGLLPAIDIVVILFSKDLSKFKNNPQIIMWGN